MSISASALYDRVRRNINDVNDWDTTSASLASSGSTVTVADSSIYRVRWPIEIDQETMMVTAIPTGTTLTVRRGVRGSTATTHASGATILIRPAFTSAQIFDALNEGIQACYPYIYKEIIDTSLTTQGNVWEYTIPNMPGTYNGDTIPIPAISYIEIQEPGVVPYFPTEAFAIIRGATPKIKFFNLQTPGALVRLRAWGPYPDLASWSDTLDTQFPRQAVYLPPLYAASALLMTGEAGRVRLSSGAVDDREQANRAGSSMAAGQGLYQRFQLELMRSAMAPMPKHVRTRV